MVFSVFLNSFLHQTREGRKNVDWRINLLVVKLSIDEYLSFCDVASQIRNRMGDIIVLNKNKITGIDKIGI